MTFQVLNIAKFEPMPFGNCPKLLKFPNAPTDTKISV